MPPHLMKNSNTSLGGLGAKNKAKASVIMITIAITGRAIDLSQLFGSISFGFSVRFALLCGAFNALFSLSCNSFRLYINS